MERKELSYDKNRWKATMERIGKSDSLTRALAPIGVGYYNTEAFNVVWNELTTVCGAAPDQLHTLEQFWTDKLERAVRALTDRAYAAAFPDVLAMRLEGPFSSSPYRRSYRTENLGYYAGELIALIGRLIRNYYYTENTVEKLFCKHDDLPGYEYLLARELRRGNPQAIAPVREAICGENSRLLLSRKIIRAIIISGHEELTDELCRLLCTAGVQEGLRQQILENADGGSIRTLEKILRLCREENLFRFSSAVRALDVWTGLGCDDTRPERVRKCARLAYETLTDETKRRTYIDSSDNLEAYFALWGQGTQEIAVTYQMAEKLLDDERKSRRILGWYFVRQTDSSRYRMALAARHLDERDEELLAWIVDNLSETFGLLNTFYSRQDRHKGIPNADFPSSLAERRQLFFRLKAVAEVIGNGQPSFSGNPFPWSGIQLNRRRLMACMMSVAGYDMDREQVDALLDLAEWMDVDQKTALINWFLVPKTYQPHRDFLRRMLDDRSVSVKEQAVKKLGECSLKPEDLDELCRALRSKSSGLRKAILTLLQSQSGAARSGVIRHLLASEEEYALQAAIEMLMSDPALMDEHREALNALHGRKLSTQTEILLQQLTPGQEKQSSYTKENGFGLYAPQAVSEYLTQLNSISREAAPKRGLLSRLFGASGAKTGLLTERQLKAIMPTWEEYDALLARVDQVFSRHADYEYEVEYYDGSRHKLLWGDIAQMSLPMPAASGCRSLSDSAARPDMLPFWSEFQEALGEYARNSERMLGLYGVSARRAGATVYGNTVTEPWFVPVEKKELVPQLHEQAAKKYRRYWIMTDLFQALPRSFDAHTVFAQALSLYQSLIAVIGEDNLDKVFARRSDEKTDYVVYSYGVNPAIGMNHRILCIWRGLIEQLELSDEDFARWFALEYRLERIAGSSILSPLRTGDYFRAYDRQQISRDVLMDYLIDRKRGMPGKITTLTNPGRWKEGRLLYETYPWAGELVNEFLDRIVTVEEKRGELPTDVTPHCRAVERLEGAGHFCRLLAALGRDSFTRGYEYSSDNTKKTVLSRLLKRCYPAKDDTSEELAALLKATDISDKRLAEAVMYAPQWAGFAETILNWPGLKSAVWFFHAHINDNFSAEKETEVALYSPISPQRFNDGAFDKNWFMDAYQKLGEKRFQTLYKAAKYITAGSNQHRRSQLYADAVLGRLDADALRQEITQKRNQEKLRAYPLIPIAAGDTPEALRRYEFIQQFMKESRQFGAQRRESEKKACAIALENLAITTGYSDVNRLIWQMETAKTEELRPLTEPVDVEGYAVSLKIDGEGETSVAVEKGGKVLKTLPKALAKNEIYLERKESAKELKEQKQRARESFERAMTEQTEFTAAELRNLLRNPVLSPMVRRLLWCSEGSIGFLSEREGRLVLTDHNSLAQPCGDTLRLAHPHDLKTAGVWADWMHRLYDEKLVQPFKQVFREYYPLTADERQERTISRRYAGFQVQPKRTLGLLKARGWTVDYEEGLQKVFYKENLIVRMYAMADWFSPADIEAPTLETVEFFNRETGENVALEEIPPILFSEVMRDLDLVVSVAYVGGVDPEASHSTVELRLSLAGEILKLLHIDNVQLVGSHARIEGKLANWSVHMGSGVVHAEGKGSIAILPVHSQARGRIFLPFADDDPKTAEILSKIVLLAEDTKIKDPAILGQL